MFTCRQRKKTLAYPCSFVTANFYWLWPSSWPVWRSPIVWANSVDCTGSSSGPSAFDTETGTFALPARPRTVMWADFGSSPCYVARTERARYCISSVVVVVVVETGILKQKRKTYDFFWEPSFVIGRHEVKNGLFFLNMKNMCVIEKINTVLVYLLLILSYLRSRS